MWIDVSGIRRFTRGLRFRLTASYALFFSLLLILAGFLFRQELSTSLTAQSEDVLNQEWAAMKGYLRIENKRIRWYYDRDDPDENFIVEQLRRIYLLTDETGNELESSTVYQSIGFDSAQFVRSVIRSGRPHWTTRHDKHGVPYLIRSGVVWDEGHHFPYFIAIGRPLGPSYHILEQFTFVYLALVPVMVLAGCGLGWFLAGRGLAPVMEVARTAQRISASNLSLRIPTRGAGDELDYLISTFNRMIQRLESSFRQIRQFSTDVSHELRTPITAIRGQLEVAMFTAKTVDQYRDAIVNALQDIERLSQIVRALLLLSQAESGQLALQKSELDLAALIRDLVEQFQIPADAAQVRLTADVPPRCTAEVDRIQVERMLSNLLSNALKFTPPGGQVTVSVSPRQEEVSIVVADTGCGIPREHLPHIFDRFYQVRSQPASPERGLGLGLSFVAWIAKAHGGSVNVESEPGSGTRFTIVLPAKAPVRFAGVHDDLPVVSG